MFPAAYPARFGHNAFIASGPSFGPATSVRARIPVLEIMTNDPVTIAPEATVADAAVLMRQREIGSVIVVEDGRPSGILTERDIVTKVAAENLQAAGIRVREVMTSPVISIHPHEEVADAARLMAQKKIRRLPVVRDGRLIGVITENDILRIWPGLLEVTRETARAGLEEQMKGIEGHCEACGLYSTDLEWDRGLLACAECRGG